MARSCAAVAIHDRRTACGRGVWSSRSGYLVNAQILREYKWHLGALHRAIPFPFLGPHFFPHGCAFMWMMADVITKQGPVGPKHLPDHLTRVALGDRNTDYAWQRTSSHPFAAADVCK